MSMINWCPSSLITYIQQIIKTLAWSFLILACSLLLLAVRNKKPHLPRSLLLAVLLRLLCRFHHSSSCGFCFFFTEVVRSSATASHSAPHLPLPLSSSSFQESHTVSTMASRAILPREQPRGEIKHNMVAGEVSASQGMRQRRTRSQALNL
ncbi:uncharacterized protein LOC130742455 [Lotus japonicus]|uniref:uncharacterized protein LOC130742455 n=1 Tax=Lotus japonicus TaxID=34305 RepID=UPI0025842E34|nr:uncharacterized protein LOC130742455 [Lotus japonicus]